jgi:hypothetical protein
MDVNISALISKMFEPSYINLLIHFIASKLSEHSWHRRFPCATVEQNKEQWKQRESLSREIKTEVQNF